MKTHRGEWIGMLTSVCVLLGGLLALTVRTQLEVRRPGLPNVNRADELAQQWDALQIKIQSLEGDLARLRGHAGASSEQQHTQMLAALLPVRGPGVVVTLQDNPAMNHPNLDAGSQQFINVGIIHDTDLLRVVNDLQAGGAEAIAINGERYGPHTAIRCAGPSIAINQVPKASPFRIEAIGDPNELMGALKLPAGPLQELGDVGCKVDLRTAADLRLQGFDGVVHFKFAKPVSPEHEESAP